jgi:amino acid adenylation domain-containing protein
MVIGLYGILKAGGAFVPLDPTDPWKRLAFMIKDAGIKILLTQERLLPLLQQAPSLQPEIMLVCLDQDLEKISLQSTDNPTRRVTPDNLAYMIYTSGSTGEPKGALNTHAGIFNRLFWMQEMYSLTAADRVLQKTPFSFDVSVWEFFWPLMTGACLVVARPEGHKDPQYLVEIIKRERITVLHFVPPMLHAFLDTPGVGGCGDVKRVICSGETLPVDLMNRFFARMPQSELHNLYGPTEAAVDVSFWRCQPNEQLHSVPLGRPVANTQLYILDKHLQFLPIGVPGELHIGGIQVGRGYLNRPDLTSEKFIPNPFGGGRLYKTGDLCRFLPDGNIEFIGRIDHQVKIRGFRIELGEIEAVAGKHPGVQQAVTILREDRPGDKRLVSYLVPFAGVVLDQIELSAYLKDRLPPYMLPSTFVFMDAIPLMANGKVDRKRLPEPHLEEQAGRSYVAPHTLTEQTLAKIWMEVLGISRVSNNDDFFDLGGNSLSALQVIARIQHELEGKIPVYKIFESPCLADLALQVDLELNRKKTLPNGRERLSHRKRIVL